MRIFLIGPGGVGKTTVRSVLAPQLGLQLFDLDEEFCTRVANIGIFIREHGYNKYLIHNSRLCSTLIDSNSEGLFVLSSGFLSTDILPEVVEQNRCLVASSGVSVLLLPSKSLEESMPIVVERQIQRGLGLEAKSEAQKFAARFSEYLFLGDIKVFSTAEPEVIATTIVEQLNITSLNHITGRLPHSEHNH